MYICLCHAVTEKAIYDAVDRGVSTFSELAFSTGCGSQCGSCAKAARQTFKEAIGERNRTPLTLVSNNAIAA